MLKVYTKKEVVVNDYQLLISYITYITKGMGGNQCSVLSKKKISVQKIKLKRRAFI